MRPVHITDTTLRDAHQSLWATRMQIGDMLPILPVMDSVGYWSMEVWGGATFDAMLRFLDENPWERLRVIRKHCPKTPLQMLLRGQNLVGYRHYSDEVVERFVRVDRSTEAGRDFIVGVD
jgi:oxaloacetate decarboxylase alpha subunit